MLCGARLLSLLLSYKRWDHRRWTQETLRWTWESSRTKSLRAILLSMRNCPSNLNLLVWLYTQKTDSAVIYMEVPYFQRTSVLFKRPSSGQNTFTSNHKRLQKLDSTILTQITNISKYSTPKPASIWHYWGPIKMGKEAVVPEGGTGGQRGKSPRNKIFHFISSNWSN